MPAWPTSPGWWSDTVLMQEATAAIDALPGLPAFGNFDHRPILVEFVPDEGQGPCPWTP